MLETETYDLYHAKGLETNFPPVLVSRVVILIASLEAVSLLCYFRLVPLSKKVDDHVLYALDREC